MHRRGGKRIRMDEPPPEYDNPMTPALEQDQYGSNYGHSSNIYHDSYGEHAGTSSDGTFESPPTPGMRRITRSKARGITNPPAAHTAPSANHSPTSGGVTTTAPRGRGRGRPPTRKNYQTEGSSTEDDTSLYTVIKNSKASLTHVVDDWIESYKVNREAALISLMQFFINAAGCKGRITQQMQATMEHAAIIRKMTEEFDEESGEYPLIMTGQSWKKFRQNYCDFVQTLVKQCQYSIIYDQFLMDNIISLLTGLSDSQVRAFRHTATLGAMKLMTALVDVALTVSVNLDNTQRQYEAERQKTRERRASDRLETLLAKRQELEENMDEIKNMLTYMFKSVFVHRYRDTLPEIRAIAMTEIGIWMHKFHANFLDDSYLKYIGWTLHDKVGEVRLRCLQALQPLYANEELKGKLELFTNKFKDRIVAMTLDKEYDVAVQAVRLVISILKHHHEILTDKDCEHVYELVYSSHRAVAQAAGEFLNERLFQPSDLDPGKTKRGKKRLSNTPFIRDLVQFFIESELHEHAAYLVDSLIESNPMMKDWECMTDLLLEEPGPHEEPLDNRQETSLIEIMVCCVKQAATGEAPVGRGPTRKVSSLKEIRQVGDDKQKLTEHFIATLPPLLDKYSVDPEKLANLLTIPQYFDLDLYTSGRQEGALQALLAKMKHIAEIHHEQEVLETCAKTLEFLCSEGHSLYTRCDVSRSTIVDMIVSSYKDAIDDWRNLLLGEETPNADETFNVVSSLKKLSLFYACHNLNQWSLWNTLFQDMKDVENPLPPEAQKYCLTSCFFYLLWGLRGLETLHEGGGLGAQNMQEMRQRLDEFISAAETLIRSSPHISIREEAYVCLCDLLIVFSEQLNNTAPPLAELACEPDRNLLLLLNEFVQVYVFVPEQDSEHDEHRIEELHKRRNFLAAYCKLVVYNIVPTKAAADVFKHYVKHYNDYGDIIKTTLGKAREINKVNCALTMCLSLNMMFQQLQQQSGGRSIRQHDDFFALKELAKRFALSFGLDAVKNREAITALHRAGILFAVSGAETSEDPTGPPPNLPFLDILSEFTNKLLKQDKKVVLSFMDRRIPIGMPSSRGEDWQPLLLYRNSLLHGDTDVYPTTSKRAYGRKRKDPEEDPEHEETLDDDSEFPGCLYN
ncbi:cohesin subunit SA-1 [Agrilus planipennis]|uniref:Cohesin subunit SA-1 n=1 Tax=Agrilus planipennis TaxID=224129 RepID=A0A7F5RN55_AGRPL|nr:cohesin subunit SA-1 [Agrilus planipennis]XP_025837465.1 cohesin subunit SA-1 [Agrilus planipennis]